MLAEEHAAVGAFEVRAVMHALGRGGVRVVGAHDLDLDVIGIEAVGDGVGAQRHDQEPDGGDLLTARDGQNRPSAGTYDGDGGPQQGLLPCPYHFGTHAYGQSLRIANHTFGFGRRVIVLEFQLARCRGLGCGGGHNNPLFLSITSARKVLFLATLFGGGISRLLMALVGSVATACSASGKCPNM